MGTKMSVATAFFYLFSGVMIASAFMVIAARNPVHSVLFLILAFVNASGLFLGSTETAMLGNVVESKFLKSYELPTASALSVILIGAIMLLVTFYVRRSGTDDLL